MLFLFAKVNLNGISHVTLSKESTDNKGYIMRYYDLHLHNGESKKILFYLRKKNGKYLIYGCNLILGEDFTQSRAEPLKIEDATKIIDLFDLFKYKNIR